MLQLNAPFMPHFNFASFGLGTSVQQGFVPAVISPQPRPLPSAPPPPQTLCTGSESAVASSSRSSPIVLPSVPRKNNFSSMDRKKRKPIMEKHRRDRMNETLRMMKEILEKSGRGGQSKLEKADILNESLKYLIDLMNRNKQLENELSYFKKKAKMQGNSVQPSPVIDAIPSTSQHQSNLLNIHEVAKRPSIQGDRVMMAPSVPQPSRPLQVQPPNTTFSFGAVQMASSPILSTSPLTSIPQPTPIVKPQNLQRFIGPNNLPITAQSMQAYMAMLSQNNNGLAHRSPMAGNLFIYANGQSPLFNWPNDRASSSSNSASDSIEKENEIVDVEHEEDEEEADSGVASMLKSPEPKVDTDNRKRKLEERDGRSTPPHLQSSISGYNSDSCNDRKRLASNNCWRPFDTPEASSSFPPSN